MGEERGGEQLTVLVFRNGLLVPRTRQEVARSGFPAPRLSRLEPYASPIDGKEITSWGQRERDLRDSGSYDPRDAPKKAKQP